MKPFKDIIDKHQLENPRQKCSTTVAYQDSLTTSASHKKRTDAIFTALANTFFEKFTGRFPTVETLEVAKRIWTARLQHISDHQIKFAIEQCNHWVSDFAPTLPQFIDLCKQSPSERRNEPALKYIPVADIETARKNIDKLRLVLGMKPKYAEN